MLLGLRRKKQDALGLQVKGVNLNDLLWDRRRLDHRLLLHVLAGVEATRDARCLSWACDKVAGIGGMALMNSVIVMPNNFACIGVPQVP